MNECKIGGRSTLDAESGGREMGWVYCSNPGEMEGEVELCRGHGRRMYFLHSNWICKEALLQV